LEHLVASRSTSRDSSLREVPLHTETMSDFLHKPDLSSYQLMKEKELLERELSDLKAREQALR